MTNTTSGRSIDPRFDPAFQPGYDPQSDPARGARVPSYDAGVDSPRQQPGRVIDPPHSRFAPDGALPPSSYRATDDSSPTRTADTSSAAATADDVAVTAPSLRRNPFLIALWVLGVAMVGLGLYTGQQVLDPSTDLMNSALRGDTLNYFSVQLLIYTAPLLLAVGVGTLVLALFLHALRWRSRT